MSKFPKPQFLAVLLAAAAPLPAQALGDPGAGEQVFKKCRACHMVGEDAANRVGPHLNDVIGRTAGGVAAYTYSPAMTAAGAEGLVWAPETLTAYLADPKGVVSGTRMAFAGLKKDEDLQNIVAYLETFSQSQSGKAPQAASTAAQAEMGTVEEAAALPSSPHAASGGPLSLGRPAAEAEVASWDIDIRPDGAGLPEGRGTVAEGEVIFTDNCAACHGDFGEGRDRWPVVAGGFDTLTRERPEKTVGSYWPYLSTVYDYVRRAMPFGNARSLSDDEVYALTAYILYLNDIVTEEDFELSRENFTSVEMPNAEGFVPDDRAEEAHYQQETEPCMAECKSGPVEITMRAQVLDVTPDAATGEGAAGGNVD